MFARKLAGLLIVPVALHGAAFAQSVESSDSETVAAESAPRRGPSQVDAAAAAQQIVEQTNDFRRAQGLPTVQTSEKLRAAARDFASFMARTDKYGHHADDRRPAERVAAHDYEYCVVAENIAYQFRSTGFTTADLAGQFATGWKESPGHRENMLDPDVLETGVAAAQSDDTGYWYAVQVFARPQSEAIEFVISNRSDAEAAYSISDREFTLPPRYSRTHQRCRPSKLQFKITAADKTLKQVEPSDGDQYVIEEEDGNLAISRSHVDD